MTPYKLIISDADCHLSAYYEERSDCVVRALSIVTGWPYTHVYHVVQEAGRKRGQGFASDRWIKKRKGRVLGGRFKLIDVKGLTPNTFAEHYPKGRYLVETIDHTYPVLDGITYDLGRTKEQPLTGAWRWIAP